MLKSAPHIEPEFVSGFKTRKSDTFFRARCSTLASLTKSGNADKMAIDTRDYYERYGPMVMRRCRALLRNEDDALDAMQETFVRVLEREDTLTDDAPSSLLYRMATNVCLNRIRSASRRPEVAANELVYEIAHLSAPGGRTEARNFLRRIFRREKPSTRQIAAMYWLEDRTYQEVADAVGMSVSGVRKRLRQLKSSLERQGLDLRG